MYLGRPQPQGRLESVLFHLSASWLPTEPPTIWLSPGLLRPGHLHVHQHPGCIRVQQPPGRLRVHEQPGCLWVRQIGPGPSPKVPCHLLALFSDRIPSPPLHCHGADRRDTRTMEKALLGSLQVTRVSVAEPELSVGDQSAPLPCSNRAVPPPVLRYQW